MVINGVCSIALAAPSIYAGISLWRVLPNGNNCQKISWGSFCLFNLISFSSIFAGLSEEVQKEVGATSLSTAFVTALYLYVWYQYLKRSG